MKNWFANLEYREQLFVGVGAFVVAIVILWGLVWMPVNKHHRSLQQDVSNWQRSLSDLRAISSRMQSSMDAGGSTVVTTNQSAIVIVDQTLGRLNLNSSLKRRNPTPNGIRVEFENVAFDDLAVWLGDLSARYAMEVQAGSMSLASQAGPGRINATLTLERAP